MLDKKYNLEFLVQCSLNAVNLIFLAYLVVYAFACPSAALVGAVLCEIGFYLVLLGYRLWRARHPLNADQAALASLDDDWKAFGRIRVAQRWTTLCASLMVTLYLCVDFGALLAANFGYFGAASRIYECIAPPASQALHPGFSMELLAGAYIESKQFKKAEPIEYALYDLRRKMAGEHSELIASMAANLGDMYSKEKQYAKAEKCYLRAINLTRELVLPEGYGSPMTKLGSLYAAQHRYAEAQSAFDAAVAIRSQLFGANSEKVAQTWEANADMLARQGRLRDAERLRSWAAEAKKDKFNSPVITAAIPVTVSAASMLIFWKRDRLLLFAANFARRHFSK